MFVRLTRPGRTRSAWFLALLYLFCVLAPGVALALGEAAPCHAPAAAATGGHEHVQPLQAAAHQHHEMQADLHGKHHAVPAHSEHRHNDNTSPAPCCALMCVSAIAADPPAVANPSSPVSLCAAENFRRLPGEAPPLLYRPPIA